MKVYVVYQENGFGGSEVAEIFSSRNIAREYVIDEIFRKNQVYQNKPENVLNNCADKFIHEHDVLFNWLTADAIRRHGLRCTPFQPCINDK